MKKIIMATLLAFTFTVPVYAGTCPCGCGNQNCYNYQQWTQDNHQPRGYWTPEGYFYIPTSYYSPSGKYISAGYYSAGNLPEDARESCYASANQAAYQQYFQQLAQPVRQPTYQAPYYPSAPVVKPDSVTTRETATTKTTNTTFSVSFPDGVNEQIVYVPGVGTVLANRNGTFQILK